MQHASVSADRRAPYLTLSGIQGVACSSSATAVAVRGSACIPIYVQGTESVARPSVGASFSTLKRGNEKQHEEHSGPIFKLIFTNQRTVNALFRPIT